MKLLQKLWSIYSSAYVIIACYWVLITLRYGFNLVPQSDAEMEAQGFGFLMFVIVVVLKGK